MLSVVSLARYITFPRPAYTRIITRAYFSTETYFSIDPFSKKKSFPRGSNNYGENNFHRTYSSKGVSINFIKNKFSPLFDISSSSVSLSSNAPRRGALSTRGGNFIFPSFEIRPDFDSPSPPPFRLKAFLLPPSFWLTRVTRGGWMRYRKGRAVRQFPPSASTLALLLISVSRDVPLPVSLLVPGSPLPSFLLVDDVSAALFPTSRRENNAILHFR